MGLGDVVREAWQIYAKELDRTMPLKRYLFTGANIRKAIRLNPRLLKRYKIGTHYYAKGGLL